MCAMCTKLLLQLMQLQALRRIEIIAVSWMLHSIFYQAQVKENVWFGKRFDEFCQWI